MYLREMYWPMLKKLTTNQQNKFDITILISLYENFRANDTPAHSGET